MHKLLMIFCLLVISATVAFAQHSASASAASTPIPENPEIKQGVKQDIIFKETESKDALKTLGKSLKYNVVFDESVKSSKLDLELNDVTAGTALKIIFLQQKLRAFLVDGNTLYIHADNPQIKERFAAYNTWTPKEQ